MINEIAMVRLLGLFGWKMAAIYFATGLGIALLAGWVIGRLKMERFVEDWVYQMPTGAATAEEKRTWPARIRCGLDAVRDIVGRVWLFVVIGIAVGAGIHGYVPENFMASIMGKDAWWSVPLAVLIGVPMYSNAAGIIPDCASVARQRRSPRHGAGVYDVGHRAVTARSHFILRKVLKPRLIATFFGVVALGILLVGYLFNAVL